MTPRYCYEDLRDRKWNPLTGSCQSCGGRIPPGHFGHTPIKPRGLIKSEPESLDNTPIDDDEFVEIVERITMTRWYCFVEANDWEGETWRFHFPSTEVEFARMRAHLDAAHQNSWCLDYDLVDCDLDEAEVTTLVNNTTAGYMDHQQKLDSLDPDLFCKKTGDDLDRALYKGGVRNFQKETP